MSVSLKCTVERTSCLLPHFMLACGKHIWGFLFVFLTMAILPMWDNRNMSRGEYFLSAAQALTYPITQSLYRIKVHNPTNSCKVSLQWQKQCTDYSVCWYIPILCPGRLYHLGSIATWLLFGFTQLKVPAENERGRCIDCSHPFSARLCPPLGTAPNRWFFSLG